MDSSIVDHDGQCPRCESTEIQRELFFQTTMRVLSGYAFTCLACRLDRRGVVADREAWWNDHKTWRSPHVPEETWEAFIARWPKKVGRPAYGHPEPLGPILPRVTEPRQ